MSETLLPLRRHLESQATTARANGRGEAERDWLDALHLLDRAESQTTALTTNAPTPDPTTEENTMQQPDQTTTTNVHPASRYDALVAVLREYFDLDAGPFDDTDYPDRKALTRLVPKLQEVINGDTAKGADV